MPDISDLYPKPPASVSPAGSALMNDPLRALAIIPALRTLEFMPLQKQQLEQTIQSQQLHMQGQRISNQQQQTALQTGWRNSLYEAIGNLADFENPTMDDVRDRAARAARLAGIPGWMVNAELHALPTGGPALKKSLIERRMLAAGVTAAGIGSGTAGYGPGGQPTTGTPGQAAYSYGGVPQVPQAGDQTQPYAMPSAPTPVARAPGLLAPTPGTAESQSAMGQTGAAAGTELLKFAASEIPNLRTQLELMRKYNKQLAGKTGPWADVERRGNLFFSRLTGAPLTMSPEQIAAYEGYEKASNQMSQAGAALHPTDKFLSNATASVPGPTLSQLGAEGLVNVWHGNLDAAEIKARAWQKALDSGKWTAAQHLQWADQFNRTFDPRVFQWMRMDQKQQQIFLESIPDKAEFARHLKDAEHQGWIKLPKQKQSSL